MSRIRINSPLPRESVTRPYTVTVSWELDSQRVTEAQKCYEAARQKWEHDTKNKSPSAIPDPLPFLVRLEVDGLGEYYQYHFDTDQSIGMHTFQGIQGPTGQRRVKVTLVYTQCTADPSDDDVLHWDHVSVNVV